MVSAAVLNLSWNKSGIDVPLHQSRKLESKRLFPEEKEKVLSQKWSPEDAFFNLI